MALGPYVPFEHWPGATRSAIATAYAAKAEAAADRIREHMRTASCTCARAGEFAGDGRCSRCWGWPR
jgi:hypothetical protein